MELAELENSMWESLSVTQQQALLEAYEDSENEDNLIPFSQIIEKYDNWAWSRSVAPLGQRRYVIYLLQSFYPSGV